MMRLLRMMGRKLGWRSFLESWILGYLNTGYNNGYSNDFYLFTDLLDLI